MKKIVIIGLGYVGLPLATVFGKKRNVIGFDIDQNRIAELKNGNDYTLETTPQEIKDAIYLSYTDSVEDIKDLKFILSTSQRQLIKTKNQI